MVLSDLRWIGCAIFDGFKHDFQRQVVIRRHFLGGVYLSVIRRDSQPIEDLRPNARSFDEQLLVVGARTTFQMLVGLFGTHTPILPVSLYRDNATRPEETKLFASSGRVCV